VEANCDEVAVQLLLLLLLTLEPKKYENIPLVDFRGSGFLSGVSSNTWWGGENEK
jgi:hypothetical protein